LSRIYLDTNIILEIILKRNDLFPDYQQLIYNIKKYYSTIVIPQIVVGETLIKIIEGSKSSEKDQNVCEFVKFLEDKKHIDFFKDIPPLYDKVMITAVDIKQNVDNIDYCDAVIVAHVINDGTNCTLFTVDTGIHNSPYISDIILKLNKKKNIIISLTDSI
jgi:predicted nucleic acid-binding protein